MRANRNVHVDPNLPEDTVISPTSTSQDPSSSAYTSEDPSSAVSISQTLGATSPNLSHSASSTRASVGNEPTARTRQIRFDPNLPEDSVSRPRGTKAVKFFKQNQSANTVSSPASTSQDPRSAVSISQTLGAVSSDLVHSASSASALASAKPTTTLTAELIAELTATPATQAAKATPQSTKATQGSYAPRNPPRVPTAPNPLDYIIGARGTPSACRISWVLHQAVAMAGDTKEINAAVELVNVLFYFMRHYCRAVRFGQEALHQKNRPMPDTQHIILLWKDARAQLKKTSPFFVPAQRLLLEVDLYLAAELSLTEVKKADKLDGEAEFIKDRLIQRGYGRVLVHDGVARAYNAAGMAWERIGKLELALQRKQQALEAFTKVHKGVPHVNVAALLSNVGLLLEIRGHRQKAIEYKRKGLEMLISISNGVESERIATALNNLGVSLQDSGLRDEGIDYQRQGMEMRRRLYSNQDHEKLASSLNSLGKELETSGIRDEGIQLLREGLAMNRRLHPAGHRNFAMNLVNLGSALMHIGPESLQEACDLLREAVKVFRELKARHEADGEDLAISLNNLAIVEERFENWEEGLHLKQEALIIRKRLHGERDLPCMATSLCCVGESLARRPEKRDQGTAMLRQACAMYDRMNYNTLETLLTVSALLPYVSREEQKFLAFTKLPSLRMAMQYASTFHRTQLKTTFAAALGTDPGLSKIFEFIQLVREVLSRANNSRGDSEKANPSASANVVYNKLSERILKFKGYGFKFGEVVRPAANSSSVNPIEPPVVMRDGDEIRSPAETASNTVPEVSSNETLVAVPARNENEANPASAQQEGANDNGSDIERRQMRP